DVPVDDPCRSLVRGDTEHTRMTCYYVGQVGQTLTGHDVHVRGGVAQIAETLLVSRVVLDVVVVARRAANQEVAEDRHAGRGAADDPAALEYAPKRALALGATIGRDVEILAAAVEPDALGLPDDGHERVAIGDFAALRKEHADVVGAVFAKSLPHPVGGCVPAIGNAVVGNVEDERVRAARCIDERLVDLRPLCATSDRDDGAVRRAYLDGSAAEGLGFERRVEGRGRHRARRGLRGNCENGGESEGKYGDCGDGRVLVHGIFPLKTARVVNEDRRARPRAGWTDCLIV